MQAYPQKLDRASFQESTSATVTNSSFPKAPASATRAQPLSSGAMHDRIHGPTCGSIHRHGIQNSGGPPKPPKQWGATFSCPPLSWIPWWWMLPHMGPYMLQPSGRPPFPAGAWMSRAGYFRMSNLVHNKHLGFA